MPEKVMPGPVQDTACIREAVCIHTKKIYDSCKEEDIAPFILLLHRQQPQALQDGKQAAFLLGQPLASVHYANPLFVANR